MRITMFVNGVVHADLTVATPNPFEQGVVQMALAQVLAAAFGRWQDDPCAAAGLEVVFDSKGTPEEGDLAPLHDPLEPSDDAAADGAAR